MIFSIDTSCQNVFYWLQIKENCRAAAMVLCWEKEEERLVELYRNL